MLHVFVGGDGDGGCDMMLVFAVVAAKVRVLHRVEPIDWIENVLVLLLLMMLMMLMVLMMGTERCAADDGAHANALAAGCQRRR